MNLEKEREIVRKSIAGGKVITLVTYTMQDSGEARLKIILEEILEKYGYQDYMEMLYTCSKEMVINATKANLKRVLFLENNFALDSPDQYDEAMLTFKDKLIEQNLRKYESKFRDQQFSVHISFIHSVDRLLIKVKNRFIMFPQEEERVRSKAAKAMEYEDLIQFYMAHSDSTEGAGLGITLITILLRQAGFDPHWFVIFSNQYNETVARIEIPLKPGYQPKRLRNQQLLNEGSVTLEDLRGKEGPQSEGSRLSTLSSIKS